VIDTGGGLPAGLGQRIFEPFVSTKETGLGLGLPICKRIVEAHEGEI
jgi:signal transduction histidine kinase